MSQGRSGEWHQGQRWECPHCMILRRWLVYCGVAVVSAVHPCQEHTHIIMQGGPPRPYCIISWLYACSYSLGFVDTAAGMCGTLLHVVYV